MILKGLSLKDSFSEIEVHGQFSPPDFSDDCYELYTFSLYYGPYMYVYKNKTSICEYLEFNGKEIHIKNYIK